MTNSVAIVTFAGAVCVFASSAAQAQSVNGANVEQIYRLSDEATYQEGCWDPCDCPLQEPLSLRGTMVLGPTHIGDAHNFREITNVNWYVSDDNLNDVHTITGSGSYVVTNFPGAPPEHALALVLQIDGGEPQNFWSEFQPVTTNDGSFDIEVSINGMVCYDIVLRVDAAPVPPSDIVSYRLGRGATYQEGCFDPCDCILHDPVPLAGGFRLVPLRDFGTYVEYAVVDVELKVVDPPYEPLGTHITGDGLYTLIAGFAGMIESLELELSFNDSDPIHFESGFINSGEEFPEIEIDVSMNGMVCFDVVLGVEAAPKPSRLKAINAIDVESLGPPNSGR